MKLHRCILAMATSIFALPIWAQEINWIDNYPEALQQAKLSGKPILLTFRCVP